jgi:hypothetical protein
VNAPVSPPRLSAFARVGALGASLALASCGVTGSNDPLPQASSCPAGLLLADASEATIFRDGPGRDLSDVVAQVRIADIAVACSHDRQGVRVDLQVAIGAERGPANRAGRHEADYFVALVDPEGNVLRRDSFRVAFVWPENRMRVGVVEDLEPRLVNVPRERAPAYRIWVGLQLNEEQLARNRSGARRRCRAAGETVRGSQRSTDGAEGATAPETLRQKDRGPRRLWKEGCAGDGMASPKM